MSALTAEILRTRVAYDPETGTFTWLLHPGKANGHRAWDKQWAGQPISRRIAKDPHNPKRMNVLLRVLGKHYTEGRLAWLHVHGRWPAHEIDHRDGDPTNNRIENLRDATHAENQHNKGPMRNNKLGIKGVGFNSKRPGRKQYYAQIRLPDTKTTKHLGWFLTAKDAARAYAKVAQEAHGSFLHPSVLEAASDDAAILKMEQYQ